MSEVLPDNGVREPARPIPGDHQSSTPMAQPELNLGVMSTGNSAVDAALSQLDGLADRPVHDHPQVYTEVHQSLNAALTDGGTNDHGRGEIHPNEGEPPADD